MSANQAAFLQPLIAAVGATPAQHSDTLQAELGAAQVFLAGAGRSGLVARFLAMRLMHCGFKAHVAGDTVTPSMQAGDTLLLISGSGSTAGLVTLATKARALGGRVFLITATPDSVLGKMANTTLVLPAPERNSLLGTGFELTALLWLESFVAQLVIDTSIQESDLKQRHTNLE